MTPINKFEDEIELLKGISTAVAVTISKIKAIPDYPNADKTCAFLDNLHNVNAKLWVERYKLLEELKNVKN